MVRHLLSHGPRAWLAVVGGFSKQLKVGTSCSPGLPLGSSLRRSCAGCQVVGQPPMIQFGAVADEDPGRGCPSGRGAGSRAWPGIGSSPLRVEQGS